ncbi:uncharacterized protein [Henckelia pumila]|uniref:uncharacterized protein n=1 Tax=Henckelia pumila TaxID=405737 RepID=UPI003C6E7729
MEAATFLLEGRARKWWRSASAQTLQEQGHVSWADFCKLFRQLYFPPALRQGKAIETLNLNQGAMTIDEYQYKFIDLLPYCPHIGSSSKSKYDNSLQALNQEIFDIVTAEISLRQARELQSSRPSSSLGPRAQYFKKQGATSSSSVFGGVFRFGHQRSEVRCEQCMRRHPPGQCRHSSGACFLCGEMGHLERDCPNRVWAGSGGGSQATVQQQHPQTSSPGHYSLCPYVQGQVFALNQEQAQAYSERMIVGTFSMCGFPACILIDTGASHSFISAQFVKKFRIMYVPLDVLLVVSTPICQEVLAKRIVVDCVWVLRVIS